MIPSERPDHFLRPTVLLDDAHRAFASTTWQQGGRRLALSAASVAIGVSVVQRDDGTPVSALTLPVHRSGALGPQAAWAGKPLALIQETDGASVVARVLAVQYDSAARFTPTVILDRLLPEPFAGAVCQILCPCFTEADLGKRIWISDAAHPKSGHGNPITITPFRSTITQVVSPAAVDVADPLTAVSRSDRPGSLVVWGSDNTPRVRRFGTAAVAEGARSLSFTGAGRPDSTGLACLFDWIPNHGPATPTEIAGSALMAAVPWVTVDCDMLVLSACGARGNEHSGGFQDSAFRKSPVPWNAPPAPAPAIEVVARQHFPRCATLDEILVVVTGDSWAVLNAGGHAGNDHTVPIIEELVRQNPAKRIRVVNRGIGGASWAWLNARREPGGPQPAWYTDPKAPWLSYIEHVTLPNGEVRTPDLVLILMTGNNDSAPGGAIHRNDVASVVGKIRSWPAANGHPPDVAIMSGGMKDVELFSAGGFEAYFMAAEYVTTFLRSFARCNRIGLFDLGTAMGVLTDGWAPEHLVLRQVPPLRPGCSDAVRPYVGGYLCRDFYMALRLGGAAEAGASFWADGKRLSVSLSAKGDNRLWFGAGPDGMLEVCAVSWGMPIETAYSFDAASGRLRTDGQERHELRGAALRTAAPGFAIWSADAFREDMVGKCLLVPAIGFQGRDFRTNVQSLTNQGNLFVCDGNGTGLPAHEFHVGGQMFVASDAAASADCIVGGAGAEYHLLTGSGSLVSRCATYHDYRTMVLGNRGTGKTVAANGPIFLGSIALQPTRDQAVPVAHDPDAGPILTLRVQGTRARIGYVRGGLNDSDLRALLRDHEEVVWHGEVERMGGPFVPRIWCSSPSTVQIVDMWIGERQMFMPQLTHRETWGVGDPDCTWPTGGDTSHMSQLGIRRIIGRVAAAQNLSL